MKTLQYNLAIHIIYIVYNHYIHIHAYVGRKGVEAPGCDQCFSLDQQNKGDWQANAFDNIYIYIYNI